MVDLDFSFEAYKMNPRLRAVIEKMRRAKNKEDIEILREKMFQYMRDFFGEKIKAIGTEREIEN